MTERIPMLCAYCGATRIWPDHFPSRIYAQCTDCVAYERVLRSPFARLMKWLRSLVS